MGCTESELADAIQLHFNQQSKLAGFTNPSLFLHAEQDHLVGVHHAIANHDASGAMDKTLVRFPRGDHNSILAANVSSYLHHLGLFLHKLQG